jgi:hypothetical protein
VRTRELNARAVLGERRLEIFRSDGKRLNWFILNQRGEPMLFGSTAGKKDVLRCACIPTQITASVIYDEY